MESKIPTLNEEMRTDIISFSSMVGERGSTWETRYFLARVVSEAKSPAEDPATWTMHKIWQILLWSFGCLVKGVWPYADWAGRALHKGLSARGCKECWPALVWRLQVRRMATVGGPGLPLQLPGASPFQFFDTLRFSCGCNRSTVPWTALAPRCHLEVTLVTVAEWSNTERHILFSTPSVGVNVFHVCLDVLDPRHLSTHFRELAVPHGLRQRAPWDVGGEAGCRVGADVHRLRRFGHGRW